MEKELRCPKCGESLSNIKQQPYKGRVCKICGEPLDSYLESFYSSLAAAHDSEGNEDDKKDTAISAGSGSSGGSKTKVSWNKVIGLLLIALLLFFLFIRPLWLGYRARMIGQSSSVSYDTGVITGSVPSDDFAPSEYTTTQKSTDFSETSLRQSTVGELENSDSVEDSVSTGTDSGIATGTFKTEELEASSQFEQAQHVTLAQNETLSDNRGETQNSEPTKMLTLYCGVLAPESDFLYPYSSSRYFTQSDLDSLEAENNEERKWKSQMAINEIFARYGYTFTGMSSSAIDTRRKFEGEEWYVTAQSACPTSNQDELLYHYFNDVERTNVEMINHWQDMHHLWD